MKKDNDYKKRLSFIKRLTFILLLIAGAIIVFSNYRFLGGILVFIALFIEWKFYRCPYCKKTLDTRINLYKCEHCPHCGKKI